MDYPSDIAGTIFEGCYLMQLGGNPVPHLNGTFAGDRRREEISCCRGLSLAGLPARKIR
ncbi:MAG: hypothetical protein LUP97_05250 [Methanoregula sp.]|nr:hypothetical protein [Methanoregula sp.]